MREPVPPGLQEGEQRSVANTDCEHTQTSGWNTSDTSTPSVYGQTDARLEENAGFPSEKH